MISLHAAGLLARWGAQIATGEDAFALNACVDGLARLGYDPTRLEPTARAVAALVRDATHPLAPIADRLSVVERELNAARPLDATALDEAKSILAELRGDLDALAGEDEDAVWEDLSRRIGAAQRTVKELRESEK